MKTISIRISVGIILGLILVGASYYVGYRRGHRIGVNQHVRFDLVTNLKLYRQLESGDTNTLANHLRFLIYLDTEYYDSYDRSKSPNPDFGHSLEEAHAIVAEVRSELSPPEFFKPYPADFSLSAVGSDGKHFDLREHRGRVVVLNIWATWCGPCMAELPSLGKLASHYSADKDVAIVCVSQEPAATVFKNTVATKSGAPLYSLSGDLPKIYKTYAIPTTFIISKDGLIVARHIGSADWSAPSVISLIDSLRHRPNTEPLTPTAP